MEGWTSLLQMAEVRTSSEFVVLYGYIPTLEFVVGSQSHKRWKKQLISH